MNTCPYCEEDYDDYGKCACDPDGYDEEDTHQCQCKYCMCLNDVSEWEDVCNDCRDGAHQG